jgi:hypothetical protein
LYNTNENLQYFARAGTGHSMPIKKNPVIKDVELKYYGN